MAKNFDQKEMFVEMYLERKPGSTREEALLAYRRAVREEPFEHATPQEEAA